MAVTQLVQPMVRPRTRLGRQNTSIPVRLPDMFVLFLSGAPKVNPHYDIMRRECEAWICNVCSFDERTERVLGKTDFAYFCSIAVPHASPEELRTVIDWGNWVFPFDDQFDNGGLKDDPVRAQELVDRLLAGMAEDKGQSHYEEDPLVRVHNSVWDRMAASSPAGVRRRFAKTMTDYCNGSIEQVRACSTGRSPSLEEMLALRRQSAGVSPLFALVEYAHKLNLPDCVFEARSIKEIERIGIDLVLLQNDILSYCKEEKEGVAHNMVATCRSSGMPAQKAFNHVGNMLVSRYRDWYLALAELPSWGEEVDYEVQEYILGVVNVVKANLNWSFRSGRYFGKANEAVRKTWMVTVRPQMADFK
ncbi:pentalenene synthase [Aspergillus campestris IBT 28561]|uniref:Terpene synthase n=1 Tax=Aspergillus campestris (strain IBT 28561) TaxID=1392248 RepID=A0A2I1D5C0_ASPC2|nr:pentalenene synthase [Aspergillus campestris IBT 28561]PKY05071.1 pentalenene synthase [Aspergillus campestris IBT 28561]